MSSNKARLKQHFLINDSSSMAPGWYHCKDPGRMKVYASVIQTNVRECPESDSDGIDISFVNSDLAMTNIQTPEGVGDFIEGVKADGFTPTAKRLKTLVDDYWNNFDPEKTHPKSFIIVGDAITFSATEATRPYPLIETILGCCLEALRRDLDPRTVNFVFLLDSSNVVNEMRKDEFQRYAECCSTAVKTLDGLKGKYLDSLRKKIVDEPKLKKHATEIENSSENSPGRFDNVHFLKAMSNLTKTSCSKP